MRVVKKAILALVVLVSLAAAAGFLLPRHVHVERAIAIDAPRTTVFTLVNGFKGFNRWSPWYVLDPSASYSYDGPAYGVGAKVAWKGNPDTLGSGSQEILESRPYELVKIRLDFGPQGMATGQFRLATEGAGTRVTWAFDTDLGLNPVSRYMGLLFDRLVGADFEKGLANLKQLAESLPKADFADLQVELVDVKPMQVAFVPVKTSTAGDEIAAVLAAASKEISRFIKRHDLDVAGAPITINHKWGDDGYEFDVAVPVDQTSGASSKAAVTRAGGDTQEGPAKADDKTTDAGSSSKARELPPVQLKQLPGGRAARTVHVGADAGMRATYDKLFGWLAAHGFEPAGSPWDESVREAGDTPDAQLATNVYVPVK